VKRLAYLSVIALVALMILVPSAMAQDTVVKKAERTIVEKKEEDLPKSGGPAVSSVLMPAAALVVGSGVLAYAVLRRRR
jgi:LPXTG cell wall anchor motif